MKNVLVLGAGLIARPLLHYLLTHYEFRLLVATLDVPRAQSLMGEHPRGSVVELDVRDEARLSALVAEADMVVSLLPADLNPAVARIAIAHRTPMVNSSYASPEMRELDDQARTAGVLILNEMGLDPGIDHMSATSLVRRIRSVGGVVTHFSSCCGGFPAPDANTNPWGYKFSWSPRAVLTAGRRPARYLASGRESSIPGEELFAHSWPYEVEAQGIFEIYPNRDALAYIPLYRLEGVQGMFRGTIRYPGWCATMHAAGRLGLFDTATVGWPPRATFADLATRLLPRGSGPLFERVAEFLDEPPDSEVIARLEWAGLFSDRPLPDGDASPFDLFLHRLETLMMYQPGERDMVALQHLITVAYPDGSGEQIHARLVQTGEPWGDSAMARTVSLPAGIASRLILAGGVTAVGIQVPVLREIYEPVLEELEERGIALAETHTKSFPGPLDG
jgi:saccharopine dehydrogenase-like NADP-dependent oxidoreductase